MPSLGSYHTIFQIIIRGGQQHASTTK